MNDRLCAAVTQRRHQRRPVADIAMDHTKLLSGNPLHPLERFGMAVAKIVEDGHVLSSLEEFDSLYRELAK